MGFSIYRKTRSVRLTVTTPDGERVVVDNLSGDEGFRLSFDCVRGMTAEPGEATVTVLNLPPDVLGILEAAQASRADDLDALLVGKHLESSVVAADGSDALKAGFLIVEVDAGYDGTMSRVFRAIGARSASAFDGDDVTLVTTIAASENLDGAVLGLPSATFPAGAATYEVMDYLRRVAGLGPGNLSPASLAAILGDSRLDSPYHVSGGQALARLTALTSPLLTLRWFVDDRDIWVCARDDVPSPTGAVPWIADGAPEELEPIIGRPSIDDGGQVTVTCLLCPRVRPGRLVRLTEDALGLAYAGLSPTLASVVRARIKPGVYRCEEVRHTGTTGPGDFTTTVRLRAVTGVA